MCTNTKKINIILLSDKELYRVNKDLQLVENNRKRSRKYGRARAITNNFKDIPDDVDPHLYPIIDQVSITENEFNEFILALKEYFNLS